MCEETKTSKGPCCFGIEYDKVTSKPAIQPGPCTFQLGVSIMIPGGERKNLRILRQKAILHFFVFLSEFSKNAAIILRSESACHIIY